MEKPRLFCAGHDLIVELHEAQQGQRATKGDAAILGQPVVKRARVQRAPINFLIHGAKLGALLGMRVEKLFQPHEKRGRGAGHRNYGCVVVGTFAAPGFHSPHQSVSWSAGNIG